MAELIVYTGRLDLDFLHAAQSTRGADLPEAMLCTRPNNDGLKRAAAKAKLQYRMTSTLRRRLDNGEVAQEDITRVQHDLLRQLDDGRLRARANEAIRAYGHGTVHRSDGQTVEIGGSTGGVTRRLLDGEEPVDIDAWMSMV